MILFLPIDIDLSNFDFTQLDNSKKLTAYNPFWDSSSITDHTVIKNNFNQFLDQLPFKKITVLTYKIQQRPVGPHIDVYPEMDFEDGEYDHIKENEPCGYRFVLAGNLDRLEVFNGREWVVARTPTVPCCYLINSTIGKHRVKLDPNRTIIYVRGILDTDAHQMLIKHSYSKYNDYVIESVL